jgi:hypothetical protein
MPPIFITKLFHLQLNEWENNNYLVGGGGGEKQTSYK